ncbi:MAG TPA: AraC family transcriptional regulator [Myxococcota bacterium]|nr:AraC family transcriptional regulator [Myxococcota bacterium]
MKPPTCWSHGLAHVIDWAVERGAKRERLLARIPLAPELLRDAHARVPLACYYAALEAAVEELGDPFFGLHYVASVDPSALGALGFLALASPTAGECLARIFRYHAWLTEGELFAMEVVGDEARFRYEPWGPPRPAHAQSAEMYAADCFLGLARATGKPIAARSLRFVHAPHGPRAEYVKHLGASPDFSSSRYEWSFAADVLERPMLDADPALERFLERQVSAHARGFPSHGPLAEQVRRALAESLPEGGLAVAALARKLRVSARTLQRRLAEQGTSVAKLLDGLRRSRAEAYLELGLPPAEVSYLVGFAEPSVFFRAFKRWTGETPAEFRARSRRSS